MLTLSFKVPLRISLQLFHFPLKKVWRWRDDIGDLLEGAPVLFSHGCRTYQTGNITCMSYTQAQWNTARPEASSSPLNIGPFAPRVNSSTSIIDVQRLCWYRGGFNHQRFWSLQCPLPSGAFAAFKLAPPARMVSTPPPAFHNQPIQGAWKNNWRALGSTTSRWCVLFLPWIMLNQATWSYHHTLIITCCRKTLEDSRIRATNMGSVETNILLTGSLIQFCCMLTSHTSFSLPANAIFFRPQPTAVLPTDTPPDMHQHIKRIRPETILGGQLFANKQNSKVNIQW